MEEMTHMNKEKYDKILTLMALDMAYENEIGLRYVDQKLFDRLLKECGVDEPDIEYIENRLISMINDLIIELG
jgi:hypothetical protein